MSKPLYLKTKETWLETYQDCINKGYIDLYNEEKDEYIKTPLIVGMEMRKEIDKLVDDLSNPKYIYDTKESEKRIRFKETCCFQGKKPFFMKAMSLMLQQKAFWEVVYSFKMADTGIRRFNEVLELVGRKNGKSTDLASDGNFDLFLGSGGEDIVCASNDDKQASLIWKEIGGMRGRLDTKNELTRQNLAEIRNDIKNITIFKMSEKTQNKDGRNIDKCYYDEMHDSKTNEIFMACWESMSIKDNPLLITSTTEGFINDGLLDEKLEYARGVLNDEIDDEHFLPWLFTQDSTQEIFQDKWSWCKSNPSLIYGVKKWSFIEKNMIKAKLSKSSKVHMLCKDFNIKQNSAEAWLQDDCFYPQNIYSLEDFKNCVAIAGADLSQTSDLTCVTMMFMRPNDEHKYFYNKYFIPESKLDSDKNGGARYREWAQRGFVEVHEGNRVSLSKVAEWYLKVFEQYNIRIFKLGYDQRFANDFLNAMKQIGYGYKKGETCEMINQNKYIMSTPMKHLEADLKSQYVQGLNEVDLWCFKNTTFEMDNNELILPAKMKTEMRIDGTSACIDTYAILYRYENEYMKHVNEYNGGVE